MSHHENRAQGPAQGEPRFRQGETLEAQEKNPSQPPILLPPSLVAAAQLGSGVSVHIQTQSPALNLVAQQQQPPVAPNAAEADFSISEDGSGRYFVPPQFLTRPAGSGDIYAPLPASQPSSSSSNRPITTVNDVKERAVVSCHSCRSAKIRCDRVQPTCRNCTERSAACTYEESVRRRGPDKKPGTRIRRPAQSGGEKQSRVHPYRATRPNKNSMKSRDGAEATRVVPNTLVVGIRGKETALPPHNPNQTLPLLALPPTLPPPLSQSYSYHHAHLTTAPSVHHASQLQPYEPYIYHNPVQKAAHQTWFAYASTLRVFPAPQVRTASISNCIPHHQSPRGSSESTENKTKSQLSESDPSIGKEPSLHFSQDSWWDTILTIYDPTSRSRAAQLATADLHGFFEASSAWFSFVNIPLFFSMFYHPEQRAMMQPALVLSCLAHSAYIQGSEREGGEKQRRKALRLRDFGQAAFDASYNAGWIDIPLAQASWMLALFESFVHAEATMCRMGSSVSVMDNVISVLGLTSIDAENPQPPAVFTGLVPVVGIRNPHGFEPGMPSVILPLSVESHPNSRPTQSDPNQENLHHFPAASTSRQCPCSALSMQNEQDPARSTPVWAMAPQWDRDAPFGVLRREEGRRLVWSALRLLAGDINRRLPTGVPLLDVELGKPTNFALLYPGENLYHRNKDIDATVYSSKESTWALYSRSVHLWVACVSHRDVVLTPHEKADFATKTWMETIAIEDALKEHHCDGERATMYQARENIFNIRMFISDRYRSFIPIPQSDVNFSHLDRRRAMEWLELQNNGILQIRATAMADLDSFPAKMLCRRPFFIWLQIAQLWRALALFDMDNSLTLAVDVVLNVLPVFVYLQEMWPCPDQRRLSQSLMDRVRVACQKAGKPLPSLGIFS